MLTIEHRLDCDSEGRGFELTGVPARRQRLIRKGAVMSSIAQRYSSIADHEYPFSEARQQPNDCGLNASATNSDIQHVNFASRLANLIEEHDDLDLAIASMLSASGCDDLVISRLKKRKLHIKDEIFHARAYLQGLTGSVGQRCHREI